MCRLINVLHDAVKRIDQLPKPSREQVIGVVDMNVEVATQNNGHSNTLICSNAEVNSSKNAVVIG